MLDVHENGMGVAGVYVKVIAEAKVTTVQALARDEGYPLRCSMSPE
jgi:ATP-dependent Clp protease adaptor protein ClpS